eukprot:Pgem_evm1s18871
MSVQDSIQVTTLLLRVNEQTEQLENKNKRSIRQKPIDDNNIPIIKMQNAFEVYCGLHSIQQLIDDYNLHYTLHQSTVSQFFKKNNRVDLSSWIEGQCNRYNVQEIIRSIIKYRIKDNINPACLQLFKIVKDGRKIHGVNLSNYSDNKEHIRVTLLNLAEKDDSNYHKRPKFDIKKIDRTGIPCDECKVDVDSKKSKRRKNQLNYRIEKIDHRSKNFEQKIQFD